MGGFVKAYFQSIFQDFSFSERGSGLRAHISTKSDIPHISHIHHSMGVHMWKEVSINWEV